MAEYIDREVFKKSVDEYYCKPCKAEGKDHNGCWCRACWVDDMLDEIDCFQPAADVAPVVHGQWITEFDDLGWLKHTCTVCGYVKRTDVHVSLGWYYCPICGQKADGGKD